MCPGSGTQTKSQVTNYNADPAIRDPAHQALNRAQKLAKQGYEIPTQQYANFTPDQLAAFAAMRRDYDIAQPYYRQGAYYTGQSAQAITPEQIENYFNPYSKYALAGLNEDAGVQNRNLSGQLAQATGGVGSDRIAVGMAEKSRTDQLARGQLMADFYAKSLAAAQQDKMRQGQAGAQFGQLGSGAQSAALQGDQALFGSGAAQQGLAQNRLNADYAAAMANIEAPWKANQYLAQITGSLAPALGGTTKTAEHYPGASPWGTIAGLGIAGLGLATGNPGMAMGGMGGLGQLFGGGGGGSYAGYSAVNPYTPNPASPWMGGMSYAADGGRIDGYAEGGGVNPFDIGEGFADGGSPFGGMPWGAWASGMPQLPEQPDALDFLPPPSAGEPPPWMHGAAAEIVPGPGPSFSPFSPKVQARAPVGGGPPIGAPVPVEEEPPALPPGGSGMMADPLSTPRMMGALRSVADAPPLPAADVTAPPAAKGASLPGAAATSIPNDLSWTDFMPRQPKTGTLSDRLLEAGLTTLAHANDRDSRGFPVGPFAAIGKGGLAALEGKRKDYSQDQKQITLEQNAKKLMEAAKHWRTTAAESARYHDLAADDRADRLTLAQNRAMAGNWIRSQEVWKDENGNDVEGVISYNKKDINDIKKEPGARLIGKGGQGNLTGQERLLRDLKSENPGISTREAMAIMKRPGTSDPDIRWKETLAVTGAKADVNNYLNDPFGTIEKHRKRLGLPPGPATDDDY